MPDISVALYQPDIAGNTGTILRTAACLGFKVHLIEPAGFDASDRALRRASMDYQDLATLTRHVDWDGFERWRKAAGSRLILLTTKATQSYAEFQYRAGDVLLFGRESAGVPQSVHDGADERLTVPMRPDARSLNLAVSVGIVAAHARLQG